MNKLYSSFLKNFILIEMKLTNRFSTNISLNQNCCQTPDADKTYNLKDKTAVITGGALGIGYSIAEEYLKEGVKTAIILDLDESTGCKAVKTLNDKFGDCKAVFYKCNVTTDREETIKVIKEEHGYVDVLVNNAGILQEDKKKKTIEINLIALVEWSFDYLELMRKDKCGKGGAIINNASICGFRVFPYIPVYQSTKFGVLGFTRCLGHEYNFNKTGVRVMALCPGFTSTELTDGIKPYDVDDKTVDDANRFLKTQIWQKAESCGKATVEIFCKGQSGSAWLSEGGNPASEVTISKKLLFQ